MLKKKNIAMAMAAATAVTAFAPVAQVSAAGRSVVDSGQTEEVKAIKERAKKLINLKFTKQENLLVNDELAGTKVVSDVKIVKGGTDVVTATNYDTFEKAFDKEYASLEQGQKLEVVYTYNTKQADGTTDLKNPIKGYTELADGTVVDFVPEKLSKDEFNTQVATGTVKKTVDNSAIAAGTIVYTEALDGSKTYEVKLSTPAEDAATKKERYMTFEAGMDKVDLKKPALRTVDGYYVNLAGDAIQAVEADDDITLTSAGALTGKDGLDGKAVIDGFMLDQSTKAENNLLKDVIVKEGHEVIKVTSTEIFNAAEGRFTKAGNDILRRTTGLHYLNGINGVNYRITKEETVLNEEYKLTVYSTDTKDANAKEVVEVEVVVTKSENDTRGAAYNAIKDFAERKFEDYIRTAAGDDRYETAAEVSRMNWSTAKQVVLVSGDSKALVDGLTATPLAASLNEGASAKDAGAPVLLTKKDEIPQVVIDELKRLNTKEVFIVGGENSVSKEVENTLKTRYGITVKRLSGDGRYETSLAVANEIIAQNNDTAADEIFVVGGKGEADALSISAVAANKKAPIILTSKDKLNAEVQLFLQDDAKFDTPAKGTTEITVVGGTNSVSESVYNSLLAIDEDIVRLAGTDRQETNAKVLEKFNTDTNDTADNNQTIVMSKSDNKGMVDALGAGALGAKGNVALVLATNNLTESQEDALVKVEEDLVTAVDKKTTNKIEVGNGIASSIAKFIAKLGK